MCFSSDFSKIDEVYGGRGVRNASFLFFINEERVEKTGLEKYDFEIFTLDTLRVLKF